MTEPYAAVHHGSTSTLVKDGKPITRYVDNNLYADSSRGASFRVENLARYLNDAAAGRIVLAPLRHVDGA